MGIAHATDAYRPHASEQQEEHFRAIKPRSCLRGTSDSDPARARKLIRAILSEDLKTAKRVLSKEILRGCHALKNCRCRFIRSRQHETQKTRVPFLAVP